MATSGDLNLAVDSPCSRARGDERPGRPAHLNRERVERVDILLVIGLVRRIDVVRLDVDPRRRSSLCRRRSTERGGS